MENRLQISGLWLNFCWLEDDPFSIHVLTHAKTEKTRWNLQREMRWLPRSQIMFKCLWARLWNTASSIAAHNRMWNSSLPWMQMLTSTVWTNFVSEVFVSQPLPSLSCFYMEEKARLFFSAFLRNATSTHLVFWFSHILQLCFFFLHKVLRQCLTSLFARTHSFMKREALPQRGQWGRRKLGKKGDVIM